MKINSLTPPSPPQPLEAGKALDRSRTDKAADAAAQPASIRSSATLSESQDVDMARVNEIRQAISEGRLQVNLGQVADGLIESTRDLLNGKS